MYALEVDGLADTALPVVPVLTVEVAALAKLVLWEEMATKLAVLGRPLTLTRKEPEGMP